eukprot:6180751-Pleurochrysis_carterae.AAC.2
MLGHELKANSRVAGWREAAPGRGLRVGTRASEPREGRAHACVRPRGWATAVQQEQSRPSGCKHVQLFLTLMPASTLHSSRAARS